MILKNKNKERKRKGVWIDKTITELRIREKTIGRIKRVGLLSSKWSAITWFIRRQHESALYILSSFFVGFLVFLTIALYLSDDFMENLPVVIGSYVLFSGMISLALLSPLKKEIHLVGGNVNLTFFKDRVRLRKRLNSFLSEIIRLSKQQLLNKYAKIDSGTSRRNSVHSAKLVKKQGSYHRGRIQGAEERIQNTTINQRTINSCSFWFQKSHHSQNLPTNYSQSIWKRWNWFKSKALHTMSFFCWMILYRLNRFTITENKEWVLKLDQNWIWNSYKEGSKFNN